MSDNNFEPKAYTFFMIPFYYEGSWNEIHKTISRWKVLQEDLYNEDILYPYIMDLFKTETHQNPGLYTMESQQPFDNESSPKNRLNIYQLEVKDEGTQSQFFFDRIMNKGCVAIISSDSAKNNNPKAIPFKLLHDGNFAPHLFVSPSAQIGIMTLCIELGPTCKMEDQQILNYTLHKRNELAKNGKTLKYRCLCPLPEKHFSLSDNEFLKEVANYTNTEKFKELVWDKNQNRTEYVNWDLNFLVNFLLNTLKGKETVKYFNNSRMQLFSFCSLDGFESSYTLRKEDIIPDLLRLSRCVNSKYLLPFDEMVKNGAVLQTFENIFFSSTIEGTSMVCIAKKENKSFIKDIQHKFNREYFLIYLLVLLQRYTLLSIDRRLIEFEAQNDGNDDGLWDLINLICKIKVNCYYTDVSVYTQHSQFYQHCCKNLNIPETFKEIDDKISLLKLTTGRKTQIILDKQKKIQEEEAKRHQEEIERIKANELRTENERKIEQDAATRRQNILAIVVGLLTIAQVIQATYEIVHNRRLPSMWFALGCGLICFFIIYFLMKSDILNFLKSIFQKSNNP